MVVGETCFKTEEEKGEGDGREKKREEWGGEGGDKRAELMHAAQAC